MLILLWFFRFKRKVTSKEENAIIKDKVLFILVRWLYHRIEDFKEESLTDLVKSFLSKNRKQHKSPILWDYIEKLLSNEKIFGEDLNKTIMCNHNVVFEKANSLVLQEKIPTTEKEAIYLAAIQFQIENQIDKEEYSDE